METLTREQYTEAAYAPVELSPEEQKRFMEITSALTDLEKREPEIIEELSAQRVEKVNDRGDGFGRQV